MTTRIVVEAACSPLKELRPFKGNRRGSCLQFKKVGQQRYTVPEYVGLVTLQTGSARFDWVHGVEGFSSQQSSRDCRITVTWRWFRWSHVKWRASPGGDGPGSCGALSKMMREQWSRNFIGVALAGGIRPELIRAFLLGPEESRDNDIPWLFYCKNEVCGPIMTAGSLPPVSRKRANGSNGYADGVRELNRDDIQEVRFADDSSGPASFCMHQRSNLDPRVLPLLKIWERCQPHMSTTAFQ